MDYRGHAQVAADDGALASLAASASSLCSPSTNSDPLASLFRSTLLALLSTVIGAFGLSPARLPGRDLEHILHLLQSVFEGELNISGSCLTSILRLNSHKGLPGEVQTCLNSCTLRRQHAICTR